MTPGRRGWIVLLCAALCGAALFASVKGARSEPHSHDTTHGRFYQTWRMPDAPQASCCDNQDCAPAASKYEGGKWWARWSDTDEWQPVPAGKVDEVRETPDGRSHMCGRWLIGSFHVYCFLRGGGV
jgi:hypothetical protein